MLPPTVAHREISCSYALYVKIGLLFEKKDIGVAMPEVAIEDHIDMLGVVFAPWELPMHCTLVALLQLEVT